MSNSNDLRVSRELLNTACNGSWQEQAYALNQLRALVAQPADHQAEQMACMPVERCYDVRAKMIIAFNEAKNAGGDLDDQLDAAYKSALRFSPNPQ
ncbi:hypothetical protein [Pseudomonas syringae]|uniref:Uncharacterized protein n=1 Tax=Pseudomonas syringae pv. solidagae TaxID=264458 RepID=A0A0Q0C0Z4_PSESX|nr:hypothetical protein [Pseudomonas syringae]KPY52825.1 Uncharacterized protein ALO46_00068 [Pseudomonas syringae pv. solidagae]RMT29874.1 hypothetical protein ALP49_00533 [Pseudomonas syringae pv. solidagae]RMT48338.1 hypothetical protein ALP48_00150 [Pseudomonas syringae pv. solidagae]